MSTKKEALEFLKYTNDARNKFTGHIRNRPFENELRTEVDDLLIAYDQMKDRLEKTIELPTNSVIVGLDEIPTELQNKSTGFYCRTIYSDVNVKESETEFIERITVSKVKKLIDSDNPNYIKIRIIIAILDENHEHISTVMAEESRNLNSALEELKLPTYTELKNQKET